jgi:protocatechuate 3,4-dioxygenase beta subunit
MSKHSNSPRSFLSRPVGLLAALLVLCLHATVLAEDTPATRRAPRDTDERTVQLDPRPIVKGSVYTDDQRPVPGAVVWLNQVGTQLVWHDEQHDDRYVTTDEAGHFQFDGLETRPCVVNLAPRGREGVPGDWMKDYQFPEALDVSLSAERPAQQVELVLRKGVTLTGSIVDEKGAPYGGVTVEASAGGKRLKETRSDPDGHFEFPGLSPTTVYTLSCFEQAFDPRSFAKVDMARGCTVSLTLARMGSVVLKVTDPGGKPVTRAVYTMCRIAEKPSRGFLQPVTAQVSADGRYPVRFLR